MHLIGLSGKKGSGKNEVGARLATQGGYTEASFAALLKESAAALFGIDPTEWDVFKNDPSVTIRLDKGLARSPEDCKEDPFVELSAREFLQRYGTEAHRDVFGEAFWTDFLFAKLLRDLGSGYKVVVTDTRFPNEAKAVREHGGMVVMVERPGADSADTHASEAGLPSHLIDVYLANDGTLEDLDGKVAGLLQVLQP